jgi:hypothetical protein
LAALQAPHDVAVRILISGDLYSGANYTRIGSLLRLREGLNPAAARRVIASLIGAQGARKEPRPRHQPVLDPRASPTPSREPAQSSGLTMEAQRRQRALAFAASHEAIKKSG